MRLTSGLLVTFLVAASGSAYADKRVTDQTPGFVKEQASCTAQQNGLAKIIATATDPSVAADSATAQAELTLVTEYCAEVTALVTFLQDNADTPYKKIELDLDARDNKVRKLRRDVKKSVDANEAVMKRLIAARRTSANTAATTTPTTQTTPTTTAPKKREVPLPPLPGSWKVSGGTIPDSVTYMDKGATAKLTTRLYASASCDQQRAGVTKKYGQLEDQNRDQGIAWMVRFTTKDATPRLITLMCTAVGKAGFLATMDVTPAEQITLADQLVDVLRYMVTPATN